LRFIYPSVTTVMTHRSTSRSALTMGFFQLPNELLQHIFSYIDLGAAVAYVDMDGKKHFTFQALSLAQVCTRFRRAVHRADFWIDKSFNFEALVPKRTEHFPVRHVRHRPAVLRRLVVGLLSDNDFQTCLERKTAWTFVTHEDIEAVIQHVPSFASNTNEVVITSVLDEDIHASFTSISNTCHSLRVLEVTVSCFVPNTPFRTSPIYTLDLSNLASFFRNLESLSIQVHCGPDMTGTLHDLRNLRAIFLTLPDLNLVPSCLPYASADSLESLSIIRKASVSELFDVSDLSFGPGMDLHPFIHLKHLVLKPFVSACVELLEQQVHGLESLEVKLGTYAIDEFMGLTNSLGLQNLKIQL
jgi:F-box-like